MNDPIAVAGVIDRERLVRRHTIVHREWHPSATLSVGNGAFAVGVDATGLQTFPNEHEMPPPVPWTSLAERRFDLDEFPVPVRTQSSWGWYRTNTRRAYSMDEASSPYQTRRGPVPYPDGRPGAADGDPAREASAWLFNNPRRLDLGRVGLRFPGADVGLADISLTSIELDLWTGRVHSRFQVLGEPVEVYTAVHPTADVVSTHVTSPLLAAGRLEIAVTFPFQRDHYAAFETFEEKAKSGGADRMRWAERVVGDSRYHVTVTSDGTVSDNLRVSGTGDSLSVSVAFGQSRPDGVPAFDEVRDAAAEHWQSFWTTGGAVSLEGSTDPRACELERRVVLSQFQTAVHCAGPTPPQETGLLYNSWEGQFHLEMHWWHAAHFVVWGRPQLLERSLEWYRDILPSARDYARWQGYAGARWPKQVGPDAIDAPCDVGPFLVWQQPHLIYYAELLRLAGRPVDQLTELVYETAEFMASYAEPDDQGIYHLGPPIIPAQESYTPVRAETMDPTFELAYWYWGLQTAQQWRVRSGLPPAPHWDEVLQGLARPHVRDGIYTAVATPPYTTYDDHPSMLMALGFVPQTPLVDSETMAATYDDVLKRWELSSTWGWDYPVLAMCATKLGRPRDAVDALLMDAYKNHYLSSGHVPQSPGGLSAYLPANGGLLSAVALMAAGWQGADQATPGFPRDGWRVQHEGLQLFPADLATPHNPGGNDAFDHIRPTD